LKFDTNYYLYLLSLLHRSLYKVKRAILKILKAKRSRDDHATHLPVLISMGKIYKIRRVIEFGCGKYSTLAFADKTLFPDLLSLEFYENNYDWYKKISNIVCDDKRVKPHYVQKEISEIIGSEMLSNADLIFIDDSDNSESRSQTIKKVCKYSNNSIVIIHDYEVPKYIDASKEIRYRYTYNALTPNTGILSNQLNLRKRILQKINLFIWLMKKEDCIQNTRYWNKQYKKYGFILFN